MRVRRRIEKIKALCQLSMFKVDKPGCGLDCSADQGHPRSSGSSGGKKKSYFFISPDLFWVIWFCKKIILFTLIFVFAVDLKDDEIILKESI